MFTIEEGAQPILQKAVDRYEKHFGEDFPLYEYLEMTESEYFDLSKAGVKRLASFIDNRIKENEPVTIPEDYFERKY